jgi:hypothetical protein
VRFYVGTWSGTVANNIISNSAGVFSSDNPTPSGITASGNKVATDPKLVSVGNATMDNTAMVDAHLQSTSPAIDKGLTLADVTSDYVGTARPQGAGYEIGAYEYIATGSPCDVNGDGSTNVVDVQQNVNTALGITACTSTYDMNKDGLCNVIDVQRVTNAALGGQCVSP